MKIDYHSSLEFYKRFLITNAKILTILSWEWWCTHVISKCVRLRQEDYKFKARLGYITKLCHQNKTNETK
jgi:hypothetical protein